jgi:hypothetical protein
VRLKQNADVRQRDEMNWRMMFLALSGVAVASSMASAQSPPSTNRFSRASLALSEQALCDRFKTKDVTLRAKDWQRLHAVLLRLSNTSVDPDAELMMTREQVIGLLGAPTQDGTNSLMYMLGWTNGMAHALWLGLKGGCLSRAGYLKVCP